MNDDLLHAMRERAFARNGTTLKQKWHIDGVLGMGGMATVYAARHRTGHAVAVKILHAELSVDPSIRERFAREPCVANRIKHPGVVRVLDDDVAEDGTPFLVMELLEGETLEDLWRRCGGRLPPDEALQLVDQLLDVVASAHASGILHRDIKPQNVFLTRDGMLKLLDFGIARALEGSTLKTVVGASLGTPAFMPPEQARGRWDLVDERTDLWAVGATLFSLLSGRFVHEGATEAELQIAAATMPARSILDLVDDLPEAVVRILERALAYDQADRWTNALTMQQAVCEARSFTKGARTRPNVDEAAVGPGGTLVLLNGVVPELPGTEPSPAVPHALRRDPTRPPTGAPITGEMLGAVRLEMGWYVTDGTKTVGPVELDLLKRGIETGKIPEGCLVCHESWSEWRPVVKGRRVAPTSTPPPASIANEIDESEDGADSANSKAEDAPSSLPPSLPQAPRGRLVRVGAVMAVCLMVGGSVAFARVLGARTVSTPAVTTSVPTTADVPTATSVSVVTTSELPVHEERTPEDAARDAGVRPASAATGDAVRQPAATAPIVREKTQRVKPPVAIEADNPYRGALLAAPPVSPNTPPAATPSVPSTAVPPVPPPTAPSVPSAARHRLFEVEQ